MQGTRAGAVLHARVRGRRAAHRRSRSAFLVEARACTSASGRQMSAFVTKLPFLYYDIIIFSKYFWGEELFVGKTAMCTLRFLRMGLGLGGF